MKGHWSLTLPTLALLRFTTVHTPAAAVTTCDEAGLRSAMSAGGTITFACSGTITLTQTIVVATNVVLDGAGQNVRISGGGVVGLFHVNPGVSFGIQNLALTDGHSTNGGAIYNNQGSLFLENVVFSNNIARSQLAPIVTARGGAICSETGTVAGTQCEFIGNSAISANGATGGAPTNTHAQGGALCIYGGSLTLTSCTFKANQAIGGPGVSNPTFPSPGSDAEGGALFNSAAAIVTRTIFENNSAQGGLGGGGGGPFGAGTSGAAGGPAAGGALYNTHTLVLTRCTVWSNSVAGGSGAAGANGLSPPFPGGTGGPGGSGGSGGNVLGAGVATFGNLTVIETTIAANRALGGAGGPGGNGGAYAGRGGSGGSGGSSLGGSIYALDASSNASPNIAITNSTLAANTLRGGDGGGGGSAGAACLQFGCTGGDAGHGGSAGNAIGGGVWWWSIGPGFMIDCTLASHSLIAGTNGLAGARTCGSGGCGSSGMNGGLGLAFGGGFANFINTLGGGFSITESIFGPSSGMINCSGQIIDRGFNLCSDNSPSFTNATTLKNTDPMLQVLADNGGPTWTMALSLGSPAIDAGDIVLFPGHDQRGVARPQGARRDIGAFEVGQLKIYRQGMSVLLQYGAPPDTTWVLQKTSNLTSWQNRETNAANAKGTVTFSPVPRDGQLGLFRIRSR